MSAKFYTLLTEIGAAKLASSAALGVPLNITRMAVGDGGGVLPTPNAQQTKLVAEKRRADLNMLYIDPQNSSQIIAEQVIPETEGGWWIREVGLFDDTGALIAVGNCPESYKPQLAEGSGRTQTVRMVLITSSTENVTLKIDPAVVLATRKYVDDKALELKVYVDDQLAKHIAAADPHTQYAQKDSPTLTGTPKAPTAPAGTNTTQIASTAFVQAVVTAINNALALKAPLASPGLTGTPTAPTAAQTVNNTQIATTAFVKSALAALVGSSPAALDTLNELATALGNDPNFATTMTNALTIRARSADFRETLNTRREKSWHQTTVGEVVKEIAARHNLNVALGTDLTEKTLDHLDQTNESDASFLMKLARQYGAIASVKDGNLLFIRQGQGRTASGKPLPVITLTRKAGDGHRFTLADRGAYTGVIASWLHTREPKKKETTKVKRRRKKTAAPKAPEEKQGDYLVGTDENVLVLNRTYANRGNAERAAKMQWERLQRGVASFSMQLAEGRADLYTEMPVKVRGFKQPIDDVEWTITTLTHTVNPDSGFTTSLDLEVKIDEFEIE